MTTLLDSIRSHARRPKLAVMGATAVLSLLGVMPSSGIAQGRGNSNSLVTRIEVLEQSVQTHEQEIQQLKEQLQPPLEVHANAVARGSYRSDGMPLSAGAGYVVGDIRGDVPSFPAELRNFFVFDLTQVREAAGASIGETQAVTIEEVELTIGNPEGGLASTASDIETYNVNRAGLDLSGAHPPSVFELMAGTAGQAGFTDLADGPGYGNYVVSASSGDSVTIRLTRAALDDLNQRINAPTDGGPSPIGAQSRLFAIGGNISTLNDAPDLEYVFAQTAASPVTLFLKVRVRPPENM